MKSSRLSINDRLNLYAFLMDRARRIAQEIRNAVPQTRIGRFFIAWEDQQRGDNAAYGKARFFREIRSFPYASRVKMAEASARALLGPFGFPWTTDLVSRLSAVAKINVDAEKEPRRFSRTGPTCLLRRGHPALQSAAGDVLARVDLDIRHPGDLGGGRLGDYSGDFSPPHSRALRFNVSRARALRQRRNQTRRFSHAATRERENAK